MTLSGICSRFNCHLDTHDSRHDPVPREGPPSSKLVKAEFRDLQATAKSQHPLQSILGVKRTGLQLEGLFSQQFSSFSESKGLFSYFDSPENGHFGPKYFGETFRSFLETFRNRSC